MQGRTKGAPGALAPGATNRGLKFGIGTKKDLFKAGLWIIFVSLYHKIFTIIKILRVKQGRKGYSNFSPFQSKEGAQICYYTPGAIWGDFFQKSPGEKYENICTKGCLFKLFLLPSPSLNIWGKRKNLAVTLKQQNFSGKII